MGLTRLHLASFLTLLTCLPTAGLAGSRAARVGPGIAERLAARGTARVLVVFALPPGAAGSLPGLRRGVDGRLEEVLSRVGPAHLSLRRRFDAVPALAADVGEEGLRRLEALPFVARIDLDEGGTGTLAQSAPLIHVDALRDLGFTGAGVTVGILDSGLDRDHPDLAGDLTGEACFCSGALGPAGCCPNGLDSQVGPGSAEDDHGHGSNVSGIVSSEGVVAPRGIAPDASLVVVKVLDRNNSFCCSSDVVAGLDWILNNRPDVDVINMSLGTSALFSGDCDGATSFTLSFAFVINALRSQGVLSFAASGNNRSPSQMTAPACIASAISVGAVWDAAVGTITTLGCTESTAADKPTCFANSNSSTDLYAPGAPITSCSRTGGISTFYGTSQAVAHAAACAADLLQADPALGPDDVESLLESTGHSVTDSKNGLTFPRIDCLAAHAAIPAACGRVPDGATGAGSPLQVTIPAAGSLRLDWSESCSPGDSDYEIYQGVMGDYASHAPIACSTGGATTMTFPRPQASSYFLVVPRNALREGSYGRRSDGSERPASSSACLPQKVSPACQ